MGKRQGGGECAKRRFDDFFLIECRHYDEIVLGSRVSLLRGGTAQAVFAQSPAPRLSGKRSHPLGRGGGTTRSATTPPNKVCTCTSAVGNLSKRVNIVAVT
jgi:hypothetical protein